MELGRGTDDWPPLCLPLVLHLAEGGAVNLDSVWWSVRGAVMTLSCARGTHFVEGGTTRTLVCLDGTWPSVVPRCTGLVSFSSLVYYLLPPPDTWSPVSVSLFVCLSTAIVPNKCYQTTVAAAAAAAAATTTTTTTTQSTTNNSI